MDGASALTTSTTGTTTFSGVVGGTTALTGLSATAGGTITVSGNISLTTGNALTLHSGTTGTGNLSVGAGLVFKADTQALWAGKGDGSASTATVSLAGAETFG